MEQADVVRFTLDVLDRLGIEYAIVGSFASIAYGEPRFTRDIDILIALYRHPRWRSVPFFSCPGVVRQRARGTRGDASAASIQRDPHAVGEQDRLHPRP